MKEQDYQNHSFNSAMNTYRYRTIKQYLKGRNCLEIGSGKGHMTKLLARKFSNLTLIEPNPESYNALPFPDKICAEMEYVNLDKKFDTIVCTNVMEHVEDPQLVLEKIKQHMKQSSTLILVVPNARSYNRLLGVDLGMLETAEQLSPSDIEAGHKRMYNYDTFKEEILKAGLELQEYYSYAYKPLHNAMMRRMYKQVLSYCMNLKMNKNGAEIVAICKLPEVKQ